MGGLWPQEKAAALGVVNPDFTDVLRNTQMDRILSTSTHGEDRQLKELGCVYPEEVDIDQQAELVGPSVLNPLEEVEEDPRDLEAFFDEEMDADDVLQEREGPEWEQDGNGLLAEPVEDGKNLCITMSALANRCRVI